MALKATQQIVGTGLTPSYTAVSGSDTFVPGPNVFLHVKNAGGSPDSVVVDDKNTISPVVGTTAWNPDLTVSVTNGQERLIGPCSADRFADPTTGLATVTHSFTTSVTVAVLAL